MEIRRPTATPTPVATTDPRAQEVRRKVENLVQNRFNGDAKKAFDHYDASKDQSIDRPELKRLLEDAKIGNGLTRGAWADGIIDKFDTNKDRKIQWGEFQDGVKAVR